jgi:hypothetical protein
VATIEKGLLVGGASANTGTLPSQMLRKTALAISELRARNLYGAADERKRIERNLTRYGVVLYCGAVQSLLFSTSLRWATCTRSPPMMRW